MTTAKKVLTAAAVAVGAAVVGGLVWARLRAAPAGAKGQIVSFRLELQPAGIASRGGNMQDREALMVGAGVGPMGAIVGGIAALKLTVAPTQNFRAVVTIKNTGTVSASFDVLVILMGPYNMQKFSTAVSLAPGAQGDVTADFNLAAMGLGSWPAGTYDAQISLWANAATQVHAVTEAGALVVSAPAPAAPAGQVMSWSLQGL